MLFMNLNDITGFSVGFFAIAGALFWPTIFIKIIIPRIERQVGRRLEFYIPSWSRTPTFIRKTSEVSFYIIAKYLVRKFTGKSSEEFKLSTSYALQRVNYRVEDAPKFFIFRACPICSVFGIATISP